MPFRHASVVIRASLPATGTREPLCVEQFARCRRMSDKRTDTFAEMEATQDALRKSIEESRRLAEKTDRLLERHRQDLSQDVEP